MICNDTTCINAGLALRDSNSKGIISMDDFSKNLLNSIKSKRPHYSEIFMETPGGWVYYLTIELQNP
jgi:hypothetical protein